MSSPEEPLNEASGLLPPDEFQQSRHSMRVMGAMLGLHYTTMRSSGLPKRLARKLTRDYARWMFTESADVTLRNMLAAIAEARSNEEDHE